MNADMLNRGTEDTPPPSLSLFFRGCERPLRPPLDPPVHLKNIESPVINKNHPFKRQYMFVHKISN